MIHIDVVINSWNGTVKGIIGFFLALNGLINITFKSVIFRLIFKKGDIRRVPGINVVILIDEIQHMLGFFTQLVPFIFILLGFGIEENFGTSWCDAIAFLYSLFISSTFVGGLPVAIVRLLFIKYQGFVQFYGEYRVVAVTELMSLITSWGLAVLHFLNKRETERRGFWISDCYSDVKNSGGAPVTHPSMFLLIYGMVTSVQLWAYFSIGHYLCNHDKIMKAMLPKESYQKRRRKNAINLLGHLAGFVIKIVILTAAALFHYVDQPAYAIIGILLMLSYYSIIYSIQLAFSPTMQEELKEIFIGTKSKMV